MEIYRYETIELFSPFIQLIKQQVLNNYGHYGCLRSKTQSLRTDPKPAGPRSRTRRMSETFWPDNSHLSTPIQVPEEIHPALRSPSRQRPDTGSPLSQLRFGMRFVEHDLENQF